ncbi:hypothetical protein PsorP6_003144 [Peronosclerospora sorghi]|uniref:Uncharacterized protein n=1 Tax=Peronosclerospora sorghi TaxID=230839 RepID=A0ACC0VKG7_9STRA|nr:hypothetical protein PsorP6_003144 [Peronosclerospora sorghi]
MQYMILCHPYLVGNQFHWLKYLGFHFIFGQLQKLVQNFKHDVTVSSSALLDAEVASAGRILHCRWLDSRDTLVHN